MRASRRIVAFGIALGLAVCTVAGAAWGYGVATSLVGADGTVHGCYHKTNGQLRVVAAGANPGTASCR